MPAVFDVVPAGTVVGGEIVRWGRDGRLNREHRVEQMLVSLAGAVDTERHPVADGHLAPRPLPTAVSTTCAMGSPMARSGALTLELTAPRYMYTCPEDRQAPVFIWTITYRLRGDDGGEAVPGC